MMTVRSKPMKDCSQPGKRMDWPLWIGKVGLWLAIASFGGLIWAVNGGYSVRGLGVLAGLFNEAGALFWATVSSWAFSVPVTVPGLPETQPVIPWLAVVASSLLQISVLWLKLSGRDIPPHMLVAAIVLSLYDFGTTFAGLGTLEWLQRVGWIAQALIALVLTFALEGTIGYLLRRR